MNSESEYPYGLPPDVAGRVDGLKVISYSWRFKTPSLDDLIDNQVQNIESWGAEEQENDFAIMWDIHCNLAIIRILSELRDRQQQAA